MDHIAGLDTLALIGLTLVLAYVVGLVFRRLGIPQVVGFLVAGVLLGPSFLHIIPSELNEGLGFVSEIALGLIGFEMGGHLRFDELRKLGRSILWITFAQAMGAFVLVAGGVYLLTGQDYTALIFGALATSTAPAATMDVLTEYKAEGTLTTTLLAVIGIDDALALLLFSFSATVAETLLTAGGEISLIRMIELPLVEIGGSLLAGVIIGWLMSLALRFLPLRHDAMVLPIGIGLFAAGVATSLHLSLILTTMTMGVVVINLDKQHGDHIRFIIEQAAPVMYVLFFALAGARMHLDLLPTIGTLGVIYVVMRAVGKVGGTWVGAALGGADRKVRNYLGLALLTQAGVAIGLALDVNARFAAIGGEAAELGALVLSLVTATMLIMEVVGPFGVKFAIIRAGEVGKGQDYDSFNIPDMHAEAEA